MTIWGNHSATQFPDFAHARIDGKPVPEVITDTAWLQGEFIETVQKRGAAVIEKRGQSSAASAAHAAIDSVNSVHFATPGDDWHSLAVASTGEYGVPEGLQFGFPVRSDGTDHDGGRGPRARRLRRGRRSPPPRRSSSTSATRSRTWGCSATDVPAWSLEFADDRGISGATVLSVRWHRRWRGRRAVYWRGDRVATTA